MSKVVIADSSCLIALSKIGRLNILQELFGEIIIPPSVYDEVFEKGAGQAGVKELADCHWIKVQTVENHLAVRALRAFLGPGESEAIILAVEKKADFIILDDKKARLQAQDLSLPVIGTVAVIKKAVEKKIIPDFSKILKELSDAGFWFRLK